MSTNVDNRAVNMQFNNTQFEQGIRTSTNSLDKLKKSLNLEDSARGLNNLNNAGRNFSLGGIASGVENISSKFSALGVVGATALMRITNAAITAGVQLVKSLTIAPIFQGYEDYKRKLVSVQTISNNTGKSVADVSVYFNKLDDYADKTIYNLDDMTGALAKFVNAGVDLDKSIPAIKGISNMTALAGQDANAARIAYYNLSQSIATGFLTTTDYKSLNLANVATKEWKDNIIKAAIAAKTLQKNKNGLYVIPGVKGAFSDAQLFNEQLSDGWATTNILLKVLGDYGDETTVIGKKAFSAAQDIRDFSMMMSTLSAQVGTSWTDSFTYILGDLDESKQLFTSLTNSVGKFLEKSSEGRNAALAYWKAQGGRQVLIEGLTNAFNALSAILKPIGDAFKEVFMPLDGNRLMEITVGFRDFTQHLKISAETAEKIKEVFKGFFNIIRQAGIYIKTMAKGFAGLIQILSPFGKIFLDLVAYVGNFVSSIIEATRTSSVFAALVQQIKAFATLLVDILTSLRDVITNTFDAIGSPDLSALEAFSSRVKEKFEVVGQAGAYLDAKMKAVYAFMQPVVDRLNILKQKLITMFNNATFQEVMKVINTTLFLSLIVVLKKLINPLNKISGSIDKVLGGVVEVLNGVKGCLIAYQNSIKAEIIKKIAVSMLILAAALFVISRIDPERLSESLQAVTVLMLELMMAMSVFAGIITPGKMVSFFSLAAGLMLVSVAVLVLAIAMKKMSQVDWVPMLKGLLGVAALCLILSKAAKALSAASEGLAKASFGLIILGIAILIFAKAVQKLGALDTPILVKGLLGLIGIVVLLSQFADKTEHLDRIGIKSGLGIILMATGLMILSAAVAKLGNMKLEELAKGLGGIALLLVMLTKFTNASKMEGGKTIIAVAFSLTVLGIALYLLAGAIKKMGSMSLQEIGKGLLTMAIALKLIVMSFNAMGELDAKKMIFQSIALIGIATAINKLATSLKALGQLSVKEIAKSLITLGLAMAIITKSFQVLNKSTKIQSSLGFIALIVGVILLAKALKMLGSLSLAEIGKSLLALGGAFVILGLGTAALSAMLGPLYAVAGIIGLVGIGVGLLGLGVMAFAAGLATLAASGAAGAEALVFIVKKIATVVPLMFKTAAEGIIELGKVLAEHAPELAASFKTLLLTFVGTMVEVAPQLITSFLDILMKLLQAISTKLPELMSLGADLILALLDGIAKNIKKIAQKAIEIVINFIQGIISMLGEVIQTGIDFIVAFINGLAEAIRTNSTLVVNAFLNLIDAVFYAIGQTIKGFFDAGRNLVQGFINGILGKKTDAVIAGYELGADTQHATEAAMDIQSPSKEYFKIGQLAVLGLVNGLKRATGSAVTEAGNIGTSTVDALKDAIGNIAALVNSDIDINPTIRPVLDLTDIISGAKTISSLMPTNPGITVTTAKVQASTIATDMNAVANTQSFLSLQKAMDELKSAIGRPQIMNHGGKIRVEGVNNEGELVAVIEKRIMRSIDQGSRRVPVTLTRTPSMA